eukprot:CAMPEP_0181487010 /NCGR_PEP_ID=MMETSP1110-20121109/47565_1 /TAXON_ID=174948 /ORGANISM="Symbiodinium sp., Strain CCMP421" /LENGTH=68 /DNA_ID=CAMNT_0023613437 /DNA_START=42 /DNA_END=244 /DNA_ORIENTATION=-
MAVGMPAVTQRSDLFSALDKNGDGVLTREELAAMGGQAGFGAGAGQAMSMTPTMPMPVTQRVTMAPPV